MNIHQAGYLDMLDNNFTTFPEAWGTCNDEAKNSLTYKCKKWTSGSGSPTHGTLNGVGQIFVSGLGGIVSFSVFLFFFLGAFTHLMISVVHGGKPATRILSSAPSKAV